MKFLIAFCMLFSFSMAQAQSLGTIENQSIESENKSESYQSRVSLRNACYTDVLVGVRYLNARNYWEDRGFFRIYPGQTIFLTNMRENFYFIHAYTSDYRIYWQGPYVVNLYGRNLPAQMVQLPYSGNWVTSLYCY